jgi:integrase
MAFVIASATLPWCFEDEATPWTDRLLFDLRTGATAAAPAHWPLEVLNSLLVAVRRGRIPREKIERLWTDLSALPTRVHNLRRTFAKLAFKGGAKLDQIQLSLGHASIQTPERYLGAQQDLTDAPCDYLHLTVE